MNPTEQKNHKTALQTLEAGMLNFAEETVNRMDGLSTYIAHVEASLTAAYAYKHVDAMLAEREKGGT